MTDREKTAGEKLPPCLEARVEDIYCVFPAKKEIAWRI